MPARRNVARTSAALARNRAAAARRRAAAEAARRAEQQPVDPAPGTDDVEG